MSEDIGFDDLVQIARERQKQKKNYHSTKRWTQGHSTDLIGLCGEHVFSKRTNLPLDTSLRACGDHGYDFVYQGVTCDVKSTENRSNPLLIEFIDKEIVADYYVLVYVNINERFGKILGWASKSEVEEAPHKKVGRRGLRRVLNCSQLHPGIPPAMEPG